MRKDNKLLNSLSLLKTAEIIWELKKRGVFVVQGKYPEVFKTSLPDIFEPGGRYVVVVARK